MIERKAEKKVKNWIARGNDALLITGARQIGKTYLIRECLEDVYKRQATLSYGLQIAGKGLEQACKDNEVIYSAVNTYDGKLTCKNVADSFDCYEYTDIRTVC